MSWLEPWVAAGDLGPAARSALAGRVRASLVVQRGFPSADRNEPHECHGHVQRVRNRWRGARSTRGKISPLWIAAIAAASGECGPSDRPSRCCTPARRRGALPHRWPLAAGASRGAVPSRTSESQKGRCRLPRGSCRSRFATLKHVVMVVPVDAQVDVAEHVTETLVSPSAGREVTPVGT